MNNLNNFIQVTLEFQENTFYNPSYITNKLKEQLPELGNELILPIDSSSESSDNIPFFVFQQNPKFNIWGNFFAVVITLYDEYQAKINEIMKKVFDSFNENAKFYACAFTFQEELSNEKISSFKKQYFNTTKICNDKFHLSFMNNIKIDNKDIKYLEGYSTINSSFISHFEFNLHRKSYKEISYEIIEDLFAKIKNYKDKHQFK